jgi:predicted tellurium resistance membrane protein TerC
VAAAAGGSMTLLILGLAISIPLVVFGATLLVTLMERYPVIITIGAALIGMVAGEMLVTDPVALGWLNGVGGILVEGGKPKLDGVNLELVAGAIGAALVVIWGLWLAKRHAAASTHGADSPNS